MKPQGISLFKKENHQAIADFYESAVLVFNCTKKCTQVGDCDNSCKKWEMVIIFLLLFTFQSFSQTVTLKLDNGDYVTQKVIYNSELELVSAEKLQPTQATYTDIKLNKYKVYSKNQNVYYIKQTKLGYKKFKIKIQ